MNGMDEEKLIAMGYSPEIACKMRIFRRSFDSGNTDVLENPEYQRLSKRLQGDVRTWEESFGVIVFPGED